MTEKARALHDEWRRVDEAARRAEEVLSRQWDSYFFGEAREPPVRTIAIVRELRDVASAKLTDLQLFLKDASSPSNREPQTGLGRTEERARTLA